ncbi:tRNA (adenosine(37)-N6)-threonylcarbamoyltransferase complex dimerization subunit type 1 TsaB [Alcaligenes sp. SDU_A2]|uniref:tRNA (adenosine(37)-N6)-threonylcarbamoyltransferase complex dimerization subunit type 1 TsaB n=1 Tax=Alcaligenes sp. SDU_A2 TaxID=3136634 RepID=UPI00311E3A7F
MDAHILALESSSSLCELALLSRTQDGVRVCEIAHEGTGDHAERLLPMADQLLAQAGVERRALTAIAFGQGPGGFTGLRVACGVAQGMAFALGLSVLPVSSLLAAAARAQEQDNMLYVVVQDARMGEVYAGVYAWAPGQGWRVAQAPVLLDAERIADWIDRLAASWSQGMSQPRIQVLGDAVLSFPALVEQVHAKGWLLGPPVRAGAQSVARLALQDLDRGLGVPPELAMPLYVRDKVAFTISEREQGHGGNPSAGDQPLIIEAMRAEHLDAVLQIERQVQTHPWTSGNFADGLAGAGYYARVAHRQGVVQGFAVWLAAPDVMQLLLIGVQAQRRGVGRQLLDDGLAWTRSQGLDRIVLEVRVSNAGAIAFYRSMGFQMDGVRKNYYPLGNGQREDAVLMSLVVPVKVAP